MGMLQMVFYFYKMGWGLRIKDFNIMRVYWKIQFLRGGGGSQKNQYIGGIALKRGLGQFSDLRGGLAKKRGWCF